MARTFDGTDDYLEFATDHPHLDPYDSSFWVGIRFKRARTGATECLVGKGGNTAASTSAGWSLIILSANTPVLRCYDGTNRASVTAPAVSDTNWHTLLVGFDRESGTVRGYLDGSTENFVAGGGGPTTDSLALISTINTTGAMRWGRSTSDTQPFQGTLGETFILRGINPTADEVAAWHSGVVAERIWGGRWGLIADWPMCGNSLDDISNGSFLFRLTASGAVEGADPPLLWTEGSDTAWASDDFERANGNLAGTATSVGEKSWAKHGSYSSDITIAGGSTRRPTGTNGFAILPATESYTGRARMVIRSLGTVTGDGLNLVPKFLTGADTLIQCGVGASGTVSINKRIAGTGTAMAANALTFSAPSAGVAKTIGVEVSGSRWLVTEDGRLAAAYRFDNDTDYATSFRRVPIRWGLRQSGTGTVDASNYWAVESLEIETGVPVVSVDSGTSGGATSDYYGHHLPCVVATNDYLLVGHEARYGGLGDDEACDVLVQRIALGDWSAVAGTVAIGTDGSSPGTYASDHNLSLVTLADGETVVAVYSRFAAGSIAQTTDVGTVWVRVSADQGATWGDPAEISADVLNGTWTSGGLVGPGAFVLLSSGRIVGSIWGRRDGVHYAWPIWSDDGGATWSHGDEYSMPVNESSPVALWSGDVLMQHRDQDTPEAIVDGRAMSQSSDGGETFGAAVRREELRMPWLEGALTNLHCGITRGWASGQILSFVPASWNRERMVCRYSTDDGETFDTPAYAADDGRVVPGHTLEFGAAAYGNGVVVGDYLYAVWAGGMRAGTEITGTAAGVYTYLDEVRLARVPREWLGLPAGEISLWGSVAFGFPGSFMMSPDHER